jgi:hypothetical protein
MLGRLGEKAKGEVRRSGSNGDDSVRWRVASMRKKEGGFNRHGHTWKGGSTTTNGHWCLGMGGGAVGDVRRTEANGGACIRAPAFVWEPCGTYLRHTVPTVHGFGPGGIPVPRRARVPVRRCNDPSFW